MITKTIKTVEKIADVEVMPEVVRLFPDLKLLIKENKRTKKRKQQMRKARDKAELNKLTNKIHKVTQYY